MALKMTIDDWEAMGFVMIWAIYNEKSYEAYESREFSNPEDANRDYGKILLDFSAPKDIPDGVHTVYHGGYDDQGHGLLVKNRKFVPVPTEAAVLEAVAKTFDITANDVRNGKEGLDYVFIEDFKWDKEKNMIDVIIGS